LHIFKNKNWISYTGFFTTCGHTAGGDFLGLCDKKKFL